jgi:SAM-dependent methyltransferase
MAGMSTDPFAEFKSRQRQGWKHFVPLEVNTTPVAGHLARFAGVQPGQLLLDVATGTGVLAITARLLGARVTALDLTPELLVRARENAATASVLDVEWHEGDAESLPFPDASFDVVVSQFGHMFAPRPEVVTRELLRVLKPGGRIAFATWPPEQMVGRIFALVGRYAPPPPGIAPPPQWGDPGVVRERLGASVRELLFERGVMSVPALSLAHYRAHFETTAGPVVKLLEDLRQDAARLAGFRREVDDLAASYWSANVVRQEYLLTRATKA